MTHLQVALGRVGGTVLVDGVDVSRALAGISVEASADKPHVVTLRLSVDRVDVAGGEAAVSVSRETRDVLVALGWTPPAELESAGGDAAVGSADEGGEAAG